MDKIKIIREYMIAQLESNAKNDFSKHAGYSHSYGVSYMCALIAARRGENIELATIAGMLHDVVKFIKLEESDEGHGEYGARIALGWLRKIGVTDENENAIICGAIRNHEYKYQTDKPFDEVLKDADVLAHGLFDVTTDNFRAPRWNALADEFNLKIDRI